MLFNLIMILLFEMMTCPLSLIQITATVSRRRKFQMQELNCYSELVV